MNEPRLVADTTCELGEGPVWDGERRALRWVDILGQRLWTYDPQSEEAEFVELPQPVGAIAATTEGGFVAAARDGVAWLDPTTGDLELFAPFPDRGPGRRANDAKCDRAGRLWVGVMGDDPAARDGRLYCLDHDRRLRLVLDGLRLPNGLDWSPDGSTMYFVDTFSHGVDAYAFDAERGAMGPPVRLIDVPVDDGLVDGLTVDREGGIWVALCYGAVVRRYSPDGELLESHQLPVAMPTSCAFGGADRAELFVTTATTGLSERELAEQPGAGGVFRLRPGVGGLAATPYLVTASRQT